LRSDVERLLAADSVPFGILEEDPLGQLDRSGPTFSPGDVLSGRKGGGRPSKLSAKEIKTIRALLKTADIPVSEIAARFGIARSTLYRVVSSPAS
jgi:transcriptional regulator of acetoin/glycerol metabolism